MIHQPHSPDTDCRFVRGQHLAVDCGLYSHHGIYLGGWRVRELAKPIHGGMPRTVTLEQFCNGRTAEVVHHPDGFPLYEVAVRAESLAHAWRYRLLDWNCEHWANWMATGQSRSSQVECMATGVLIGLLFYTLNDQHGRRRGWS